MPLFSFLGWVASIVLLLFGHDMEWMQGSGVFCVCPCLTYPRTGDLDGTRHTFLIHVYFDGRPLAVFGEADAVDSREYTQQITINEKHEDFDSGRTEGIFEHLWNGKNEFEPGLYRTVLYPRPMLPRGARHALSLSLVFPSHRSRGSWTQLRSQAGGG